MCFLSGCPNIAKIILKINKLEEFIALYSYIISYYYNFPFDTPSNTMYTDRLNFPSNVGMPLPFRPGFKAGCVLPLQRSFKSISLKDYFIDINSLIMSFLNLLKILLW